MPKATVKQKTNRTSARTPFENISTNYRPDDEDIDMDDESSQDIPEKDEAEKKLERMLFGDDEGFIGALKSQQDREAALAPTLSDEESVSGDEAGEEGEEGDLEDVPDEDVRDLFFG